MRSEVRVLPGRVFAPKLIMCSAIVPGVADLKVVKKLSRFFLNMSQLLLLLVDQSKFYATREPAKAQACDVNCLKYS